MKLLAIETATEACSVALKIDDSVFVEEVLEPRQHAKLIVPFIDKVLKAGKVSVNDLDAIAVSIGPGSFVGLRIGLSVAQGLAAPFDIPVVPVSTLQVIAQSAYAKYSEKKIIVAMDAFMGEIYLGDYAVSNDGLMQANCDDKIVSPEKLTIKSESVFSVGSAWKKYQKELEAEAAKLTKIEINVFPSAEDLLLLAEKSCTEGGLSKAENVLPVYLRDESAWKKM
jgi:tRNA threonylcarbamoyladenosine biosynthesis protein TsaB